MNRFLIQVIGLFIFIIGMGFYSPICLARPAAEDTNGKPKAPEKSPKFNSVFWIVFENKDRQAPMKQPYFSELIKKGAFLEKMTGEIHLSQGNYIAMVAGDDFKITYDSNVDLKYSHIGDLLEKQGRTWKLYAEDYPGNCYLDATFQHYARKHVPFLSFLNVSTNPKRCGNVVNANQFNVDLKNNALPDYVMYVPNLYNDGHDQGVDYSDRYLEKNFGFLLSDPNFLKDRLVVITFDESESYFSNDIYTVLLGEKILPGSKTSQALNHINLLRLIEDEWGLGTLGRKDQNAATPTGIWRP